MRSLIAALRTLTLPWGKTSGKRIKLDGVNGVISMFDANDVEVIRESPDGIVLTSTGGYITLDPSVGGVPFDVTQIRFGSGGRDESIIEGSHFDADAMALQLTSGLRVGVGYSRLLLRDDSVVLFADDNAGDTNGIVLTPDSSTINEPWAIQGETWHNLPLSGGWGLGIQPQYRLAPDGDVVFRGRAEAGSTVIGTVVGTTPVGYRIPAAYAGIRFVCGRSDATAQYGEIQIQANGTMVVAAAPTLASLDLSGIRYSTLP
jgi:hypothetical protein